MAALVDLLTGIFRQQTLGGAALDLAVLAAPLWVAALVGLLIGWAWRPRWAGAVVGDLAQQQEAAGPPAPQPTLANEVSCRNTAAVVPRAEVVASPEEEQLAVNNGDLMHLWRLVEEKDGGPSWIHMMDRTLPTFRYQAWRRDPPNGPPQYRSSTIFEDASPEVVRDFFWDDEFRIKNTWDDMLLQHETLEEDTETGTMVVRWVRKFPFFCSDREYIIGRRIWASGKTFYCVTKVQNKKQHWVFPVPLSQDTANRAVSMCTTLAGASVQGMWGCVKRIEPGLRAYQIARTAGEPLSKYAAMAHVTTKFNSDELNTEDNIETSPSNNNTEVEKPKHWTGSIPKVLMIGGAVALACTFDHGLLTKAVIFGTARRRGQSSLVRDISFAVLMLQKRTGLLMWISSA
ncbi:hypothetical protein PR202_gb27417 [Eleusine coracana subsp. coracana]|uniref:START domain-containing protein n=1 Tax=Eleusine coracana subsp. coracana TaxID=191504 RepID=A0AAV5FTT9_ELECO|nr:hypothetical protein PR202_gb27417 [Eleusine coracana subsp. coracana]